MNKITEQRVKLPAASLPARGGAIGDQGRGATCSAGVALATQVESVAQSSGIAPKPSAFAKMLRRDRHATFIPVASLPAGGGGTGDQGHGVFWRRRIKLACFLGFWTILGFCYPAFAENLLINPSFEGGTYGWTWNMCPFDVSPEARLQVEVDRTTRTAGPELGSASLKLTADSGLYMETLSSAIVSVMEGSEYTLSFYAKATQPVNVDVYAHAPGLGMGVRPIVYIDRHQQVFQAGPEWKRYSLKINIRRPEKPGPWDRQSADVFQLYVELALRPGQTLWMDGFQLARGELGPYDDGRPVTAGVESGRLANLFQPGEKIEPKFYFYRSKADDNMPYETRIRTEECLTGKVIGEQVVALKFAPDQPILTLGIPYPVASDRQGVFKTTVQVMANGKAVADAQFIHAVYKPLPAPADFDDDSIFAMDHILGGGHTSNDDYFRMASEIGVRSYRNEARMDGEHPERGQFFFEGRPGYGQNRGATIRTAEKYKIRPMVCIGPETEGYIPGWIRTEEYSKTRSLYEHYDPNGKILQQYINNPNAKKINLEAFGEYCYQLALHFKGRVKYYEVFNERYGVAEYPDYWRTAYENIKRADPPAKVMPNVMRCEFTVPVTNHPLNQDRFLKQKLINYCDAVSLHLYTYPVDNAPPELNLPGFEEIYASWKDLFRAGGRPEVELLETEGGHSSPSYYTYMQPDQKGTDPRPGMLVQAMRSQRKWIMFYDIGYKKYFYFVFTGYGCTGWYASLLEFNDTPKLSYLATGNAARLITGSKSLGRIKFAASEKLWGYQFQMKNGERFVTVWNVEEQPAELALEIPAAEIRAEDMLGNPLELKANGNRTIIPISGAPVYIFGNKGGKIWTDAERVKEVFAKAEAVGLVPVKFAVELARNPETGRPAVVVLATNTSGKEFHGVFQVAGLPEGWLSAGDRIGIGELAPKAVGTGYLDLNNFTVLEEPLELKAFYYVSGQMLEQTRTVSPAEMLAIKQMTLANQLPDKGAQSFRERFASQTGFTNQSAEDVTPQGAYAPKNPVTGNVPAPVKCPEPGLYAVRWMYLVERPKEIQTKLLDDKFNEGPLRMCIDPVEGIIRDVPFYGYANEWCRGLYYFNALKAGGYGFYLTAWIPGAKVIIDNVSTSPAGLEDFERANLLADGGFERGCADFAFSYSTVQSIKRGDSRSEYNLDRQEFFKGRQALRMKNIKGGCTMISRPLPMRAGQRYTGQLWVKGDEPKGKEFKARFFMNADRVNPEVRRYTGGEIGGGNVVVGNQWKKLGFGFAVPRVEGDHPTNSVMTMDFGANAPGTFWVDDIRVSLAGAAVEQTGTTPAEQLKIRSGGKLTSCKYLLDRSIGPAAQVEMRPDQEDYVSGGASLQLVNQAPTVPKEKVVGVPLTNALEKAVFLNLRSEEFTLERGRKYRLSFWARSNVPQLSVWQAIEPAGRQTAPIIDQFYKGRKWPFEQVVEVGREWKKYSLEFTAPKKTKKPSWLGKAQRIVARMKAFIGSGGFRKDAPPPAAGSFTHLIRFTDKANLWIDGVELNSAE